MDKGCLGVIARVMSYLAHYLPGGTPSTTTTGSVDKTTKLPRLRRVPYSGTGYIGTYYTVRIHTSSNSIGVRPKTRRGEGARDDQSLIDLAPTVLTAGPVPGQIHPLAEVLSDLLRAVHLAPRVVLSSPIWVLFNIAHWSLTLCVVR